MKSFLSTFVVCLILCVIIIFFLGGLLLSGGGWPLIILIALLLTISARTIASLDARIEQLEKKLGMTSEEKREETDINKYDIIKDERE